MAECPRHVSVEVHGYSRTRGLVTLFEIEVVDSRDARHRVQRRYRDFLALAAVLKLRCGRFGPQLPPKGVLRKLHPSFMAERVEGLTQFLKALLACEAALKSDALLTFLQLPPQEFRQSCTWEGFETQSTRYACSGKPLPGIEEVSEGTQAEDVSSDSDDMFAG